MGVYFLALPTGGAIGYSIGGLFAKYSDWRNAFLVVGIPGLVAAIAGLIICTTPAEGASEGKTDRQGRPADDGRLPVDPQDPELRLQHLRPGRRDLRDRCLRRLGRDVLPAGSGAWTRPRPAWGSAC